MPSSSIPSSEPFSRMDSMKPLRFALLLAALAATPVRAHFIWLLPVDATGEKPGVRMIFSDSLKPDDPDLLKRISHAELFVRGTDDKQTSVKHSQDKDVLTATLPGKGPRIVG